MDSPVPALADRATAAAQRLHEADSVLLASHIDADGLTSAAIAATALERAEIPVEVSFSKQLDAEAIGAIARTDHETVLFTDFGSGQLETIVEYEREGAFTPIVADHHQPADAETEFHLNPLLEGVDGGKELSGAGTTYVLARALAACGPNPDDHAAEGNRDLSALAVVGAVGDMQTVDGELVGANTAIAEEGVAAGVLDTAKDLSMYGTQTRPLPKLFEYASDVRIPGITNDQAGTHRFLEGLDLPLETDGEWRTWADLTHEERQTVVSGLVKHAVKRGVPPDRVNQLVGTTYTLSREEPGTVLRDASEFSTLLNATARYDRADVGLAVCLGDREGAFEEAQRLLRQHRRNLSDGLDWVASTGVTQEAHVQWFHAEDEIRETIVGIVAGMALGADGVDHSKPIIGFAHKTDAPEETKVSARGTARLVRSGLDLSVVMGEAAGAVGGEGGGHTVAAGATVPRGTESDFVAAVDAIVGDQLGATSD
jgi:RecJ-like exonuclease